ncbi:unnamed protein product [Cyprideis torosa]|uniref:Protein kinase domain-containing protein n=1 Tax=Cyprideis torosa TaxID=163714 RepID=A0A7R8ZLD5_9CRUS|nr:unnamed protein product [Cyprideis torosa]CAG0886439.1 unnamed protein product [Cyprideis torosa]
MSGGLIQRGPRELKSSGNSNSAESSANDALQKNGFQLGRTLGIGTYAVIRRATYTLDNLKTNLACKIINRKKVPKEFLIKFFPRELNICVQLDHPNLIKVHSILERNEVVYVFMQFASKGDVLGYLMKYGALEEHQANYWARQLFSAITYLFSHNITHRDLKCENLLLNEHYQLKIGDYGFARYSISKRGKDIYSETFCGSIAYAAPEVLGGIPYLPKNADLWSCGVILYALHCGALPFRSDRPRAMLVAQVKKKWVFSSPAKDNLSPEGKDLVRSLLEPNTEKRINLDAIRRHDWMKETMFQILMNKYFDKSGQRK